MFARNLNQTKACQEDRCHNSPFPHQYRLKKKQRIDNAMQVFLIFCIGNENIFYFLHWAQELALPMQKKKLHC
jgi:esterase/lipase superfamily enzyme